MKKTFIVLAALTAMGQLPVASTASGESVSYAVEKETGDTIRMIELQSVQVISNRAGEKTPVAYSTINRSVLENINTGVDLPFLLLGTPSVVATSEAGAGVGYTGIRIRGTDATRINVTANGIPMNDAESHGLFWVNIPDIAASVEDIQIQRGVGTSTNGAGAFGGSINLRTQNLAASPYGEVSAGYGSYNTHREMVNIGTGLLGGKWAFNARLSNISSDGYRDRASTDLKSFFVQGGYYGRNTVVKLIAFGGKEKTYHAWDAVTKAQMHTYGRRYNPCGEIWGYEYDGNGKLVTTVDEDGNVIPVSKLYGHYKDQTDNYTQYNYQLLFTHHFSNSLALNINLHYTDGDGYYEEYKNGRKLTEYGLTPYVPADPANEPYYEAGKGTVTKANLIRRKMMDNGFGGGVFSLDYTTSKLHATLGGGANKYNGDHFGNVIWIQNYQDNEQFLPNHEYYRNKGEKFDANIYLKANWNVARGLYLYGDVQYRYIRYQIDGVNDKWDSNISGLQVLDIDEKYNFFNPKAGISYDINPNWNVYASVGITSKEPTRNNFKDAETDNLPRRERLTDYEAGATFRSGIFSAGANLYYMKYKDQLVLTGEINHIGEPLSTNVKDSYRAGIELMAGVAITDWLRWDVNATFSSNKIKGYTDHLFDWNTYTDVETPLGKTTISFSPSVIAGSLFTVRYRGFGANLQTNYVSKQYVTNSESAAGKFTDVAEGADKLQLDAYCFTNLALNYTFKLRTMKSLTAGFTVYNLFNAKYESNGYAGTEYKTDKKTKVTERYKTMFYFPQAGTNVMANLTFRF